MLRCFCASCLDCLVFIGMMLLLLLFCGEALMTYTLSALDAGRLLTLKLFLALSCVSAF